jgi:hypothetical protein
LQDLCILLGHGDVGVGKHLADCLNAHALGERPCGERVTASVNRRVCRWAK